jgi:hypothetical protein
MSIIVGPVQNTQTIKVLIQPQNALPRMAQFQLARQGTRGKEDLFHAYTIPAVEAATATDAECMS